MNRMRKVVTAVALVASASALAQHPGHPGGGRDAFVQQQAYAEMQRVSGQVDVLQSNIDDLLARVARIERASASSGETEALKARIVALEGTVAALRRDMQGMHGDIVREISSKIAKMPQMQPAPPAPPQKKPVAAPAVSGPHREYVVAGGDTLSLIAKAFNTTVTRIKEMNGMKSDRLSVGQKLIVPAE